MMDEQQIEDGYCVADDEGDLSWDVAGGVFRSESLWPFKMD